jgi:predicted homoserine dehydrogenase-like protein
VLFGDAAGVPLAGPFVEVCAVAKRDLQAGEVLDSYGHFMTYGEAVAVADRRRHRYLPMGLVEGCRLVRALARDSVVGYDDVDLPYGRVADRLYREQEERFAVTGPAQGRPT